jgi:parvulin-like peptidyl-prolyl isomerase
VKRFLATLLVGSLLLLPSCRKKEAIPPDVVAQVGDRSITLEDFKRYLTRNSGVELAQIPPEAASALLDQYIEEALVSAYAAKQGVDVSAEQVAEAVRKDPGSTVLEKRDHMRRQRLVADISSRLADPAEAEMRKYFQENPAEFNFGERLRARQILVHDRDLANDLLRKLRGGASFEELSREHSDAPNAGAGGDIGFVGRGELPKAFEDELFSTPPGEVSKVIQADESFHIFKVQEVRSAGPVDFVAAAPVIRARLREEALNREMSRLIKRARDEVAVSVLTKRLPFSYSGIFPRVTAE